MNKLRKIKNGLWLIAIGCLSLSNATAQSASRTLSLQEAKQIALENNTAMKNAKLDVSIAKKKVIETTAIGLPQVSATANYQHLFNVPSFSFPTTGYTQTPLTFSGTTPKGFEQFSSVGGLNQYVYSGEGFPISPKDNTVFKLQVSQLIFSGEYIVGLQATRVYKLISEQSLVKSRIETEAMVESTYYMALVLAENLKIVQQNKELTVQTLKEMTAMNKAGFNEQSDLDQLQINLNLLGNLELSLQGQLKNVHNQLKYQLGMPLTDDLTLSDQLQDVIAAVSPFDGREFNIKQNIDFQMVINNVSAQKLSLRREQSGFLPTLSAFYQHQEKQKVPALDFEPKDVLGVTLSIPIFTSGSRFMKVKQAKLALEKAQNSQVDAEKGLQLKFDNQRLNYQTAYNTFLNQRESSELSQRIFDKTTAKFKQGVSSSLELTQVQSQYLTSVSNYYNSMLILLNARVELQKLTTPSN
ncbi:MAG: TolC family protein [Bacteroidales bacterium]|nr:TolC family protein [Bacteroidales bacterium]